MLEEQNCSPVVGEVLRHLASGAGGPSTNISGHGGIEGISTNDVVEMGRRALARLDDRVKSLDGQRGAWEA